MRFAPAQKSRLIIVSQVYPPDPTAVGQHLADVAETMAAKGWEVVVYTASSGYDDASVRYPLAEQRAGVTVRRIPFSSFGKSSIAVRLIAQALFIGQSIIRAAFARRADRILVSTVPPFSNIAGLVLSWIHRSPLIWWVMDLNPDQLIRLGKAKPTSPSVKLLDAVNRLTLRRAESVIVLDNYMRARVGSKDSPAGTMHVMPAWSHESPANPIDHDANPFRNRHNLNGKCVIMYSGNHGLTNPLDTLLFAAEKLRDHPQLRFLFVGGGVCKPAIDRFIRERNLPNAQSLPYQPFADLKFSLSAADIHVVSISPEAVGVSHSCKIYGAMAVGRPILAIAPEKSHVGEILAEHRCGWLCEHGDVSTLVRLLVHIAAMSSHERDALGARGAAAIREHYNPSMLIARMCGILGGR